MFKSVLEIYGGHKNPSFGEEDGTQAALWAACCVYEDSFVQHYNHKRLHSAICYVTPYYRLAGKDAEIINTRVRKLFEAHRVRIEYHIKSTLDPDTVLSDSR
jgi:hypothetical protein